MKCKFIGRSNPLRAISHFGFVRSISIRGDLCARVGVAKNLLLFVHVISTIWYEFYYNLLCNRSQVVHFMHDFTILSISWSLGHSKGVCTASIRRTVDARWKTMESIVRFWCHLWVVVNVTFAARRQAHASGSIPQMREQKRRYRVRNENSGTNSICFSSFFLLASTRNHRRSCAFATKRTGCRRRAQITRSTVQLWHSRESANAMYYMKVRE